MASSVCAGTVMSSGFRYIRKSGFYYGLQRSNHRGDGRNVVRCCICKKPLHDSVSISRTMGADCYSKFHGVRPPNKSTFSASSNHFCSSDCRSEPVYKKPIRYLFATPLGRKLLLSATIHALSPIPAMTPVVLAYDVYKAYKHAKIGHEVYTAIEQWRQRDAQGSLETEKHIRDLGADHVVVKVQDSIIDFATTEGMDVESYYEVLRETISESAKHGFDEFTRFVLA